MNSSSMIKKITSLILSVAVVMANMPIKNVFAQDDGESQFESVTFQVSVKDSQGNEMTSENGVVFELLEEGIHSDITYKQLAEEVNEPEAEPDTSGEISTEVKTTYTNTYEVTVNKKIDEQLVLKVYEAGYPEHIAYITYSEEQDKYEAILKRYASLDCAIYKNDTIDLKDIDFFDGNYTYETDYDSTSSEYILSFNHPVNCEIVEKDTKSVNPSVYKADKAKLEDGYQWKIDYETAGVIKVKITQDTDSDYQFEETTFVLNVNNKLEFLCENNQNIEGVTIEPDIENANSVGIVYKTISKDGEMVKLNLTALDTSDIKYSISNVSGTTTNKPKSSINTTDGTITIKSAETVIVTAKCNLTNKTAQYMLVPVPTVNGITVDINKSNITVGGKFGIPVITGATEYSLNVSIDNVEDIDDYYKLNYDFNPKNIISFGEKNGKITVLAMSDEPVRVTITATPESNVYYYAESAFEFYLNVNQVTPTATFYYNNEELEKDEIKTLYDMKGKSDIYQDDNGNQCLDIPISAALESNGVTLDDYKVTLKSDGLDFNGTTITNADEIHRNKEFTINVVVSDDVEEGEAKRFEDIQFTFKSILEGDKTYNDEYMYYTVEGLRDGFDEKYWKEFGAEVTVVAKDKYYVANIKNDEFYDLTYTFQNLSSENADTDHIIYVFDNISINTETTHLFFGVDDGLPTVSENSITYSGENVLTKDNYVYTKDSVTITVDGADNEGNLYCARLYIGGTNKVTGEERYIEVPVSIWQDDVNKGSATFTIGKDSLPGLHEDVMVAFFDAAGNSSERVNIGTILIEDDKPDATIDYIDSDDVIIYTDNETQNIYASKDLDLQLVVSDKMFATDETLVSGIKSYNVYINDVMIPELSKSYDIDTGSLPEYVTTVNTAGYSESGKVTVCITDIVDMANNVCDEDIAFTIYIDKENPSATFAGTSTIGNENITSFGNFYNKEVEYIFNVTDNMTNVSSAILTIGSTPIEGNMSEGKAYFRLPLDIEGEISLTLNDNVGHTTVIKLEEILDDSGDKVFESGYVVVENKIEKPKITVLTENSKGNWFNDQVKLNVNITDAVSGHLSSGLASYKVYINDKLCADKAYTGKESLNDTISVTIDRELINTLMNDDSSYTVKVVIVDNAGNSETNDETVFIDTVAPVISDLTGVVNNSINTGTVTVDVKVDEKHFKEAGNKTVVKVTKTLDGQTETYDAATFTMNGKVTEKPYTFTEDGDYTVVVTSEDAAGNTAVSKTISFTIDNTAPLANITGVTENKYYLDEADATINIVESNFRDMNVTISITSELNGVVKTIDNVVFNGTQKSSSLTHKFTEEGKYTIKVDAVDAAGNVALTKTVIFTVDVSAPLISISGVENESAYKDEVIPVITINDNYYNNYSVSLVKNGVYFKEDMSGVISNNNIDESGLLADFRSIDNGVTGTFDVFEKIQSNDGIYTLTVVATDNAGRTSSETVQFSINRFGSVYTFDNNLKNVIDTVNTSIDNDFKITEYNADKLLSDSINVRITRDGSPIDEVIATKTEVSAGDGGWYQYDYVISKDNFKYDGVYVITVSSTDEAGNTSENITYDELGIRFSVDTTKPQVVKVTGLSKDTYNAENVIVNYEVFDAIGIKEVRVYLNGNNIQTVNEFVDITSYEGSFSIGEGMEQHVRFEVEDMAGNMVDSDNAEDINLGKIVNFNNTVTVSTSLFVRWYADKTLFYGSIAATGTVIVAGSIVAGHRIRRRRRRKPETTNA